MVPPEGGVLLAPERPGHVLGRTPYQSVNEQLAWAETLHVEPRLDSIKPVGSPEDDIRNHLGRSSFYAAILAEKLGAALYADDLGLRRLALGGAVATSFSTLSLLVGLAERGTITAEQRDENLLRLVLARFPETVALGRPWTDRR